MTCEMCGYRLEPVGRLTHFEFRDDGISFLTIKTRCSECQWWNVIQEHYGPSVWTVTREHQLS